MSAFTDSEQRGTYLPNVYAAVLSGGRTLNGLRGVYMWPNGWVTIYDGEDMNQGRILSPAAVYALIFGKESVDG